MVRQDRLESLLSDSDEEVVENKAVVRFIDEFTGLLKDNLNAQNQSANDEKHGLTQVGRDASYMDISPDL
jgi:hypothetical protein